MACEFALCQVGRVFFLFQGMPKKTILSSSTTVLLKAFTKVRIQQVKLMEDKGNYTEVKRKGKWEMVPAENPC